MVSSSFQFSLSEGGAESRVLSGSPGLDQIRGIKSPAPEGQEPQQATGELQHWPKTQSGYSDRVGGEPQL